MDLIGAVGEKSQSQQFRCLDIIRFDHTSNMSEESLVFGNSILISMWNFNACCAGH